MEIYEKACDITDTLLRQGNTPEEIYVEYTNKLSAENEKEIDERSHDDVVLYSQITGMMAERLAKEAVKKAGYQMVEGKIFTFWEKANKSEGD